MIRIRFFVVFVSSPVVAVIVLDLSLNPFPGLIALNIDLVACRRGLWVSVRRGPMVSLKAAM